MGHVLQERGLSTYTISRHLKCGRVSRLAEEDHAEGNGLWKGKDSIVEVSGGDSHC